MPRIVPTAAAAPLVTTSKAFADAATQESYSTAIISRNSMLSPGWGRRHSLLFWAAYILIAACMCAAGRAKPSPLQSVLHSRTLKQEERSSFLVGPSAINITEGVRTVP